jgi:hypothetical protein
MTLDAPLQVHMKTIPSRCVATCGPTASARGTTAVESDFMGDSIARRDPPLAIRNWMVFSPGVLTIREDAWDQVIAKQVAK